MVHKFTQTIIVIAICWFIAYGVGSTASHCCNITTNICTPSGIRSQLTSAIDAHCQPSPQGYLIQHGEMAESAGSTRYEFNDSATCCNVTPCPSIGLTALPVQFSSFSPCLQTANKTFISGGNHNTIANTPDRHCLYRPAIPIFLLTKSIIC